MRARLIAALTHTEPARPLALARIAVGLCLLAKGFEYAITLARLLRPETMRVPWLAGTPDLPPLGFAVLLAVWLLAAVLFTEGRRTRAAGAVLVLLFVYLCAFDQQLFSFHTYLVFLLTFLLTAGDSGAALSRDAERRGERDEIASWPVTLLRVQLSVMYGFATIAKLDSRWLREGVMARHLGLPDSWRHPALLLALDGSAIAIEAFLAFGLWWRPTRPWAFLLGFGLHAAIPLTLDPVAPLIVFSVASLAPYVLFLDARPGSREVVFDPGRPAMARRAALCARLDWMRLHRFRPIAGADWKVTGPEGTTRGFRGLVTVLEGLPVSFLWAPALRLVARRG